MESFQSTRDNNLVSFHLQDGARFKSYLSVYLNEDVGERKEQNRKHLGEIKTVKEA